MKVGHKSQVQASSTSQGDIKGLSAAADEVNSPTTWQLFTTSMRWIHQRHRDTRDKALPNTAIQAHTYV